MRMLPLRRGFLAASPIVVALSALAGAAAAQTAAPPTAQAPPAAAEDPLRRETPRGSFMGFVEAAQVGNRASAAEYLQWPKQKMTIGKEEAAEQLSFVLNHGFEGNLDRLSRDAGGNISDGLAPDRERAGTAVLANGERVDIYLARVTPPAGPESIVRTGSTQATSALIAPPLDCMTRSESVRARCANERRWRSTTGRTYAFATVVLVRSYSPGSGESSEDVVIGSRSRCSPRTRRRSCFALTCPCSSTIAIASTPRRSTRRRSRFVSASERPTSIRPS